MWPAPDPGLLRFGWFDGLIHAFSPDTCSLATHVQ
jgi:hypothetical protein